MTKPDFQRLPSAVHRALIMEYGNGNDLAYETMTPEEANSFFRQVREDLVAELEHLDHVWERHWPEE